MPNDADPAVSERGETAAKPSGSNRLKAGLGIAVAAIAGFSALLANVHSISEAVHPTPTIDGRWQIEDTVVESSMAAFRGLKLTYAVNVLQTGDTFQAEGEKTRENGTFVAIRCRPTITISGRFLAGDQVTATYKTGVRPGCTGRQTGGTFQWKLSSHGILRRQGDKLSGKFEGDAAETAGESIASRVAEP